MSEVIVSGKTCSSSIGMPRIHERVFYRERMFKTGDLAERSGDDVYKVLGRKSVDVIKRGGYKISALEIGEVLRAHPDIEECTAVGLEEEKNVGPEYVRE